MFSTTFYSFKGGVGRTLALVNVAIELAKDGNNVALIDFDLEAPGLHEYPIFSARSHPQKGLLDLIRDYQECVIEGRPSYPDIEGNLFKAVKKEYNVYKDSVELMNQFMVLDKEMPLKMKDLGDIWLLPASGKKSNSVRDVRALAGVETGRRDERRKAVQPRSGGSLVAFWFASRPAERREGAGDPVQIHILDLSMGLRAIGERRSCSLDKVGNDDPASPRDAHGEQRVRPNRQTRPPGLHPRHIP